MVKTLAVLALSAAVLALAPAPPARASRENGPENLHQSAEEIFAKSPGLGLIQGQTHDSPAPAGHYVETTFPPVREEGGLLLLELPTINVPLAKSLLGFLRHLPRHSAAPLGPAVEELALTGKPRAEPEDGLMHPLPFGFLSGVVPDPEPAAAYGDSLAFSRALNRLSLNIPGQAPAYVEKLGGKELRSVPELLDELARTGHTYSVALDLHFANFGNLWLKQNGSLAQVASPLYINTGIRLPSGKQLTVPANHAELDIAVRGPLANADVTFHFFVNSDYILFDPLSVKKQPWTNGRTPHRWDGPQARELIERAAVVRREVRLKAVKHGLPSGGYGTVCISNDPIALVTGIPVYPLIRDPEYFNDGMTIDAWAKDLPNDGPAVPDPRRVYDSLPTDDPSQIVLPRARQMALELKAMLR